VEEDHAVDDKNIEKEKNENQSGNGEKSQN